MAINTKYQSDIDAVLFHRHDNGADFWTTEDKKLIKGAPFSTLESVLLLLELGVQPSDPPLSEVADLIFSTWREDGRFQLVGKGAIYPCHTTHAARVLCHLGYVEDERVQKTLAHLLEIQYQDGGWRCNKFSFGRGPETEYSNPMPTLMALDAFRFTKDYNQNKELARAVEFLLAHWVIRKPIGPCQYGMGSRFMEIEYPFRSYNLFQYVYVLSHYNSAKSDPRFKEALEALQSKLVDGKIAPVRVVPKLAKLNFCKKGQPSELGTKRYEEILQNLGIQ